MGTREADCRQRGVMVPNACRPTLHAADGRCAPAADADKKLVRRRVKPRDKYAYDDATDEFAEFINNEVALAARDWLVAESPKLLVKYSAVIDTDEWRRRVAEEQLSFLPIKHLTAGWAITR